MTKTFKCCYKLVYSYRDSELNQIFKETKYIKDSLDLIKWFQELHQSFIVFDAFSYPCRQDIDIKIKQVFISEKKYVSLFNC